MIGQKFGKWTVLFKGPTKKEKTTWHCRCECGKESDVYQCHLRSGKTSSCLQCAVVKHGMHGTPTYISWIAMHERCGSKNHEAFHRYGGRGITVCDEWKRFEAFFADMGARPDGLTLDRINSDLGYFKENCKWSSSKEQQNNISSNRMLDWKGESLTIAQLADRLGMNYETLYSRVVRGTKLDRPLHAR